MKGYALNERNRRKMIIDFIYNNQGCIAEDISRAVEKKISRKKVFKILNDLKKENIIIPQIDCSFLFKLEIF